MTALYDRARKIVARAVRASHDTWSPQPPQGPATASELEQSPRCWHDRHRMAFTIRHSRIVGLDVLADPGRIAELGITKRSIPLNRA